MKIVTYKLIALLLLTDQVRAQSCTSGEIVGIFFGTFLSTLLVIGVATLLLYCLYLRKLLANKGDKVDGAVVEAENAKKDDAPETENSSVKPDDIIVLDEQKEPNGEATVGMDPSLWGLPHSLEQIMAKSQLTREQVSDLILTKAPGRSVGFQVGMKNSDVIVKNVEETPDLPYKGQIFPGSRLLGASVAFDDMSLQQVLSVLELAQTNRVQIFIQNNVRHETEDLMLVPLAHYVKNLMLKQGSPEQAPQPTDSTDKVQFTSTLDKTLQRRRTFPHVLLPISWTDKLPQFERSTSQTSELKTEDEATTPVAVETEPDATSPSVPSVTDELKGYKISETTKVLISLNELKSIPNGNVNADSNTMEVHFRTVTREHSLSKIDRQQPRSISPLSDLSDDDTLTGSIQEFIDIDIPNLDSTNGDQRGRTLSSTKLSITSVDSAAAFEEASRFPVNV